jgi:Tfp pilus assembly protein PilW
MIGVVISMMGLAAVSVMMMNFSKKRTSITETLSAQDNGVMALYRLERDVGQAGYGLMPLQSCATIANGASPSFTPWPVQITDGGAPGCRTPLRSRVPIRRVACREPSWTPAAAPR